MSIGGFDNQGGGSAPMAEINTTPLVDVMLVLLIIFIITAPLLTHAVKVDLPQVSSAPSVEKPETVTLAVDADGELYWNDQPVEQERLLTLMAAAAQLAPKPDLLLRADKATRYEQLAAVMAQARNAGLTRLSFVTLPGAAR